MWKTRIEQIQYFLKISLVYCLSINSHLKINNMNVKHRIFKNIYIFLCFRFLQLSAMGGQYSAAVVFCVQSEGGGVSIWQVRPLRVCVWDSLSNDLRTGIRGSPGENRNSLIFECLCNVPEDNPTLSTLISSKLSSPQTSAPETKQEINASCPAFLFVLTW